VFLMSCISVVMNGGYTLSSLPPPISSPPAASFESPQAFSDNNLATPTSFVLQCESIGRLRCENPSLRVLSLERFHVCAGAADSASEGIAVVAHDT
jgi:hypothetical protein